ncbi:MAG: oligosaccharide flippase family protein [bacterium]|nr:oligosaccharide flippase family protein [bacterium]
MHAAKDTLVRLLRWSEKYTKTDMVYLAGGGAWLGFSQLVSSVQALVLTLILANVLSPDTFGQYRFLIAAFSILSVFSLSGMATAVLQSTPKGYKRNLTAGLRQKIGYGLIGGVLSLAAAAYYFVQGNDAYGWSFIVVAAAVPFFSTSDLYLPYLQALKKFSEAALYNTITKSVLLASMLAAAFFFREHLAVLVGVFLFSQIIVNFVAEWRVARKHIAQDDVSDPGLIPYAKHLSVMGALGTVALYLDHVLVGHFVGAAGLAIFAVANMVPMEAMRFARIVPTLAFPKFAASRAATVRATLMPKIWRYFVLVSLGVAAYIALAPFIIPLLFPAYASAVPYTQVLALSMLQFPFLLIGTYLNAAKRVRALYLFSIAVPLTSIVAVLVLIPIFGIWGAACALLLTAFVRSMILAILLRYSRI